MKPISPIRLLLGISQTEMAQFLQIPRSQVSMFESGRRDLPREAKILLAPMLANATQSSLKAEGGDSCPDPKKEQYLKKLLQENELQRISNARKLETIREQYQKNQAVLNLTAFLMKSATQRPAHFNPLLQSIRARANQALSSCDETAQLQYEIKAELLELEKLLLEEHITKHTPEKPLKK